MPKKVVKQLETPAAQGRAAQSKVASNQRAPAKVVAPAAVEEEIEAGSEEGDDDDESEGNEDGEDGEDEEEEDSEEGMGEDDVEEDSEDDEFEKQSSSDEDSVDNGSDEDGPIIGDNSDDDVQAGGQIPVSTRDAEKHASGRKWSMPGTVQRGRTLDAQRLLNIDDLSSDDEEVAENGNTIGRVPLHWYDAFDHIGYDITGQKMEKRKGGDRIDAALANRDDPAAGRTVYDMYNDRQVVLSEREMEIIRRVQAGAFAHPEYDDTPDYVDYESSILEVYIGVVSVDS
jgi:ribosome biogenesis protein ERB1